MSQMDKLRSNFVRQFFEETVTAFEIAGSKGHFNWDCMKDAVTLFRLLHREDLVSRVSNFWDEACDQLGSPGQFIGGLGEKEIFERALLKKEYPKDALPDHVKQILHEPHIAFCLDGKYANAIQYAVNDLALEEIAATQAVLGDFSAAEETLKLIRTRDNAEQMLVIIFIVEKYRRNEMEDVARLLDHIKIKGASLWDYVHLAYGFAGYEPWGFYPYADY